CSISTPSPPEADGPTALAGIKRIVFLGDSITYAGHYIEDVEAILRADNPSLQCEFIDLGLPSETVCGLTEPGHAGGEFPRPDLPRGARPRREKTEPAPRVCLLRNEGRALLSLGRGPVREVPGRHPSPPRASRGGPGQDPHPAAAGVRPGADPLEAPPRRA